MKRILFLLITLFILINGFAQNKALRSVFPLQDNWQFINEEVSGAEMPETNTTNWETVSVPHDWAIKGPFDKRLINNW